MTIYDPQHVRMAGELDAMEARAFAAERMVDQLTSQALHFRERAITAEATVARVEAIAYQSDDGTEYEHNGHADYGGEPECPGCWAATIRQALAGGESDGR